MTTPVAIGDAAQALNVSAGTLRRWIRDGAPCVRPGEAGRGHGAQVIVADVQAWQRQRHGVADDARTLERIAEAILDTYRRDAGEGESAPVALGITPQKAAALLVFAYERVHRALMGESASVLPAQIDQLWTVCVERSQATTRDRR